MTQDIVSRQEDISFAFQQLQQDRDFYIDSYRAVFLDNERLEMENEYLRKQLDNMRSSQSATHDDFMREVKENQRIRETLALPNSVVSITQKVMMITAPWQRPYSAAMHGGEPDIKITSMANWQRSLGVGEGTINNNIERMESLDVMARTLHDFGDGKRHFELTLNEEYINNPSKLVKAVPKEQERTNNGGAKVCPQCGQPCKQRRRTLIIYECEPCGLDFDDAMRPYDHSQDKGVS